jgi:hypothetical protein
MATFFAFILQAFLQGLCLPFTGQEDSATDAFQRLALPGEVAGSLAQFPWILAGVPWTIAFHYRIEVPHYIIDLQLM